MSDAQLQQLSDEATAYILNRYKRLFPYCSEGAARLRTLARKDGVNLRKVGGLRSGIQHWWCETQDGIVVDPTAGQFGAVGGIQTIHAYRYEEIPSDILPYLEGRDGVLQRQWRWYKRLLKQGIGPFETRGEDLREIRFDKYGRPYLYVGRQVRFPLGPQSVVRNILKFPKDNGNIVYMYTIQRRLFTRNDRVIYPCATLRYVYKAQDGHIYESRGGKLHSTFENPEQMLKGWTD